MEIGKERCKNIHKYCCVYNINDNPKINMLIPEDIRQKRLEILEYFDHVFVIIINMKILS